MKTMENIKPITICPVCKEPHQRKGTYCTPACSQKAKRERYKEKINNSFAEKDSIIESSKNDIDNLNIQLKVMERMYNMLMDSFYEVASNMRIKQGRGNFFEVMYENVKSEILGELDIKTKILKMNGMCEYIEKHIPLINEHMKEYNEYIKSLENKHK